MRDLIATADLDGVTRALASGVRVTPAHVRAAHALGPNNDVFRALHKASLAQRRADRLVRGTQDLLLNDTTKSVRELQAVLGSIRRE